MIIRAIGPTLSTEGVTGALADPTLELHDSKGGLVASNDNWGDTQAAEIQSSGLAPTNPAESAIIMTLDPGSYTAVVQGKNITTGVALVEVFDLNEIVDSQLANLSTRGLVKTGDNVMIGGLIVSGASPSDVVLRAIGPSLTSAGIAGALADPTLDLYDGDGAIIATNDNWKDTQEAAIEATTLQPSSDAESAIVQALSPGAYTAIVRGKNNTTGVALVEAYQLSN